MRSTSSVDAAARRNTNVEYIKRRCRCSSQVKKKRWAAATSLDPQKICMMLHGSRETHVTGLAAASLHFCRADERNEARCVPALSEALGSLRRRGAASWSPRFGNPLIPFLVCAAGSGTVGGGLGSCPCVGRIPRMRRTLVLHIISYMLCQGSKQRTRVRFVCCGFIPKRSSLHKSDDGSIRRSRPRRRGAKSSRRRFNNGVL